MCPSAFRVSSPQAQGGVGGGSNLHQNLSWTSGDVRGKFHQDRCRGMDFHQPSTYQQANKQTTVRPFLYVEVHIDIDILEKEFILFLKKNPFYTNYCAILYISPYLNFFIVQHNYRGYDIIFLV